LFIVGYVYSQLKLPTDSRSDSMGRQVPTALMPGKRGGWTEMGVADTLIVYASVSIRRVSRMGRRC